MSADTTEVMEHMFKGTIVQTRTEQPWITMVRKEISILILEKVVLVIHGKRIYRVKDIHFCTVYIIIIKHLDNKIYSHKKGK